MAWAGWHLSDISWCCPVPYRFSLKEADYFPVSKDDVEIQKEGANKVRLGVMRLIRRKPMPVVISERESGDEDLMWVSTVSRGKWVPFKDSKGKRWALPIFIRRPKRRKRSKRSWRY